MRIHAKNRPAASMVAVVGLLLASLAAAVPASGAAGQLDTSFGTGGKVLLHLDVSNDEEPAGVVVQPDGKIVVAIHDASNDTGVVVARFTRNGALDPTFSGDGKLPVDIEPAVPAEAETPEAIALQPDGKILVSGYSELSTDPDRVWFVVRIRPNGTLDPTFDGDGRALAPDVGNSCCPEVREMALKPDGKIVLVGLAEITAPSDDVGVVQFRANGSLDPTFSGDGRTVIHTGAGERARSVAVFEGKIYIAGSYSPSVGDDEVLLMRLKKSGALDPTFGTGGVVSDDLRAGDDLAEDLLVQPDGRIVITGSSAGDPMVARYLPSGARNAGFGSGGAVFREWATGTSEDGTSIVQVPSGSFLVGGRAYDLTDDDFGLFQVTRGGTTDTAFGGGDGKMTVDLEGGDDAIVGIALQGEKVIAVGTAYDDGPGTMGTGLVRVKGRAPSSTSLRARKGAAKLVAKGRVKPNHKGKRVVVTLYKRKAGGFKKVASKRIRLTQRSRYSTKFARVAPGKCKVTTRFPGDAHHQPSSATKKIRC